ncbi:MAG: hypothetical protein V7K60_04405 [Nostoc sp.]
MQFLNTLITFIAEALYIFSQPNLTIFKYPKIMLSTLTMSGADDFTICLVYYYL